MGRKPKLENEKKIKISVSIDRVLYYKIKNTNHKPSRILEKLLREYYENQEMC